MSFGMRAILEGEAELKAQLGEVKGRATRIFRAAQKRVGEAVAGRAAANTARSKFARPHLRDSFGIVQRSYRNGPTVTIIGARDAGPGGPGRLHHIYEYGTEPRYTNHETGHETRVVGTQIRNKRVKTERGWRTVKVRVNVTARRGTGSKWKGTAVPNYRGIMPAFSPLQRAASQSNIQSMYETELRFGLQRIADRYASAG